MVLVTLFAANRRAPILEPSAIFSLRMYVCVCVLYGTLGILGSNTPNLFHIPFNLINLASCSLLRPCPYLTTEETWHRLVDDPCVCRRSS
jgi:hypothetical protein